MLAEKPWRLEAVALLFLGIIATMFLGGVLAGIFAHFTADWPKAQTAFWQIVIASLFMQMPALAWIGLFLRQHDVSWMEAFGLRKIWPGKAVACGLLAAVFFVPAVLGWQMLSEYLITLAGFESEQQEIVQTLQDPSLTFSGKIMLGVTTILLAPIVEETFFRGILYPALKQTGRPRMALWVSSTLFAFVHLNLVAFVPLLMFAIVLVCLYEKFQNLLVPVVVHSLFNAANFSLLVFPQLGRLLHLT